MEELKTGYEWCLESNIRILDLLDWPCLKYSSNEGSYMEEKISKKTFLEFIQLCNVKPNSTPRKPDEYLEQRMYGLVPYNLSPIQQGIQYGHAVQEYNNNQHFATLDFHSWAIRDKTFIILSGGTTNTNPERLGTMNKHLQSLKDAEVKFATFYEPDLGDQLTAIVVLVDERCFNTILYPDYVNTPTPYAPRGKKPSESAMNKWMEENAANREKWVEKIGGAKNDFLRTFFRPFRLA